jgi:endonuclease/exonuclease/phosphatase family metal-dependent hydrolase
VIGTTVRVVTWNVWGRFGEWEGRGAGIEGVLAGVRPDLVCLTECWGAGDGDQAERVARAIGVDHSVFVWGIANEGWSSGVGIASRWPVTRHERRALDGGVGALGEAVFALVEGPRGPLQVVVVMLDYPLDASGRRQAQVRQLAEFVAGVTRRRHPTIVCGDFNAGPDSDELRLLTGRSDPPVPGLVFYDAWEVAGDGTPGHTWSNRNPLAALGLYPDRRFDYVLSAWPRAGGAGHPVHCELLGVTERPDGPQLSDHYGVLADLRY